MGPDWKPAVIESNTFYPYSGSQEQRDKISCVIPKKLYLTNHRGVGRDEELDALGITHIICVNEQENDHPGRFIYHNITTLEDQEDHDASQHFEDVMIVTNQALAQGGAVCFHCAAGISRSSTMLIAYLMASRHMCLLDAFSLVFHARRVIWPNRAFMQQLIDYELALQQKGCLPGSGPSLSIEEWDTWTESDEDQVAYEPALPPPAKRHCS
jgi:protein-tyrosine phosphatase